LTRCAKTRHNFLRRLGTGLGLYHPFSVPALTHVASGKVREIYQIDRGRLLFVATDRISAFDVVLPDPIPDKGRVLTGLSLHFFDLLEAPNHFLSTDLDEVPGLGSDERHHLTGRAMIVRRVAIIPVECVVRGYLYGSSWREYRSGGGPTTEHLAPGLRLADRLPQPIFTPSTKASHGHDQNLTASETQKLIGADLYSEVRKRSIALYLAAAEHAALRGIILADTKFEFGLADDELLLADEVLTPDSSRYWPADGWHPGSEVPSLDKQYVRDWLDRSGWDHSSPPPRLPSSIIEGTRDRYIHAYEAITGRAFADYMTEVLT
jgi:phosphoribosylaminoimidazole-succinocarboxamide synthase